MNKARRKELERVFSTIEQLMVDVDQVATEEQDAFDGTPEGLKQGERGQKTEENVTALTQARDYLESALNDIEEAKS